MKTLPSRRVPLKNDEAQANSEEKEIEASNQIVPNVQPNKNVQNEVINMSLQPINMPTSLSKLKSMREMNLP